MTCSSKINIGGTVFASNDQINWVPGIYLGNKLKDFNALIVSHNIKTVNYIGPESERIDEYRYVIDRLTSYPQNSIVNVSYDGVYWGQANYICHFGNGHLVERLLDKQIRQKDQSDTFSLSLVRHVKPLEEHIYIDGVKYIKAPEVKND